MRRLAPAACVLLVAALFLIANRGAYRGYFEDDDLDNLSWVRNTPAQTFATSLLTPRFLENNFRPAGHLYFRLLESGWGASYPPYVFTLHLLHLTAAFLLWQLLGGLRLPGFASAAGALFFTFHAGILDDVWRPMYVFDVLCGLFAVACLLAWVERRTLLSFVCFWLAYKSKEIAVMLPLALLALEWTSREPRFKRLIPFFLASLSFGLQALLLNPNQDNAYTFRFTFDALSRTLPFYLARPLLFPLSAVILVALAAYVKDRRMWAGLAAAFCFTAPLLFLPGRMFPAYTYVPLAATAIAVGALSASRSWALTAAFFVVWLPANYYLLRHYRNSTLELAADRKVWVSDVRAYLRRPLESRTLIYDGLPRGFERWGAEGVVRYWGHAGFTVRSWDDPDTPGKLAGPVTVISWNQALRHVSISAREEAGPDASWLEMAGTSRLWQLESGWYGLEGGYRWTKPQARLRLTRTEASRHFGLTANVSPEQLAAGGVVRLLVALDGKPAGELEFRQPGLQTGTLDVPAGAPGPVSVELLAPKPWKPPNGDPRILGVAVVRVGFTS